MVDGFVAQLQSVFVVRCHVGYLRLQLPVTVIQQFFNQTLLDDRTGKTDGHLKMKRKCLCSFDGRGSVEGITFMIISGGMQ